MGADNVPSFNALDRHGSKKADSLHQLLRQHGVDFAVGVPCGVIRHLIAHLDEDPGVRHLIATRESEAVGIAAGAYFAGATPVVYMQNSGLFAASNDIASLLIPYETPILFVVSYRGCENEDAVQHMTTGRSTLSLLSSFQLAYSVLEHQDLTEVVGSLLEHMQQSPAPVFLLLKRGWYR